MPREARATYSGDPASSTLDALRFLIGDTITDRFMFTNPEIEYALGEQPDPRIAGADLLEIKSRQYARLADFKVGDVSKAYSKLSEQMKAVAEDLRKRALTSVVPFFGGLTYAGKEDLNSRIGDVQPQFFIGQTDSPSVAQLSEDRSYLYSLTNG